jgi:hypothetical protein
MNQFDNPKIKYYNNPYFYTFSMQQGWAGVACEMGGCGKNLAGSSAISRACQTIHFFCQAGHEELPQTACPLP